MCIIAVDILRDLRSFVLPAGFCSSSGRVRFLPLTQLLFARSAVSPKKKLQISSFFFFCSFCFPEFALVFPNENFHVHMRTLTAAFSSSFRRGFPLLSLGVIRKCTIFALLQRMIFSRSHCTLALLAFFSQIFLGTFPNFSTNHSSSFFARLLVC